MLKSIFYFGLFAVGIVMGIFNPLWAAVSTMEVYFLRPDIMAKDISGMRYEFIAAIVFAMSVFFHQRGNLPKVQNEKRVLVALWVYAIICLATSLWAVDQTQAFDAAFDFSKTIFVASLLPLVVRNERDLTVLIWACLLGAAHAAFIETAGKHKLDWVSKSAHISPDRMGSVLMLFIPTFLLLGMYGRIWERVLCWLSLPFILDAIVRSNHRSYFVALVGQTLLLLLFLPRRTVMKIAPILLVAGGLFLFVLTPDTYWQWISTISNPTEEGSAASRFEINRASLAMVQDNPFGVGYRCYGITSGKYLPAHLRSKKNEEGGKRAHNTFFAVLCETGIPGFLAWGSAIVGTIVLLRRIRKRINFLNPSRLDLYAMGLEFGLYGTFIGDMFHAGNETDPIYWIAAFSVILTRLKALETSWQPAMLPVHPGMIPQQMQHTQPIWN